ncbi:MAG: hypothetical protein MEQ84_00195 [Mesorhizobium sp.]|nr:hypothetical protein [Mesorhizobium sp.]
MARYLERDKNALRRIAALLLALADLADRAGSMSLPVRAFVFSILRYAETIAWALVLETTSTATARPRYHPKGQPIPPGTHVETHPGPADLTRLALSLRALALILSYWLVRIATSGGGAPFWSRISRIQDWLGPQALRAPDTS